LYTRSFIIYTIQKILFSYVIRAVNIKSIIFWDVTPYILGDAHLDFGGIYCPHFQSRRVSQENSHQAVGGNQTGP
jgi:hypothetical protein